MKTEQRTFRMHEKLLLDVIMRQAGSLQKALLEGVMNSIEAGATRVDVKIEPRSIEIADDGRGFRSRDEVERFFETFGQPHDESEGKKWAQFRMGRGQLFAFGRNEWRTGNFRMLVDVKERLGYDLEALADRATGCSVRVALYDPIGDRAIYSIAREVARFVKYVEVPVLVNGAQVNTPASTAKWGPESCNDAWVRLTESGAALEVYNLGVLVCDMPKHAYGVSGVIVSRERLDVNFARNDVIRSCAVWRRIAARIESTDRVQRVKTKRSLTDDERQNVIGRLAGGELKSHDLEKTQLFVDVSGHPWSVHSIRRAGWPCWTTAPRGSAKGDKLLQSHRALVLDEDALAAFPGDPAQVFDRWPKRDMPPHRAFVEVAKDVRGDYAVVPEDCWTRTESAWAKIARDLQHQIGGWEHRRRIMIGASDCFDGWTDGKSFIAVAREFLGKQVLRRDDRPVVESIAALAALIAHEMCHDRDSATDTGHSPEFYRAYHDLSQRTVPNAVGKVCRDLGNGKLLKLLKGEDEAVAPPVQVAAKVAPAKAKEALDPRHAALLGKTLRHADRDGKVHECRVIASGFEFDGTIYKSPTAAAKAAMGDPDASVNGWAYWKAVK